MKLSTYKTAAQSDAAAISRIIKGMREAGWVTFRLHDGEVNRTVNSDESIASIVADLTACDESSLFWQKGDMKRSMYFVLGNSPWEVMADCSCDDGEWDKDREAVEAAINLEGEA